MLKYELQDVNNNREFKIVLPSNLMETLSAKYCSSQGILFMSNKVTLLLRLCECLCC